MIDLKAGFVPFSANKNGEMVHLNTASDFITVKRNADASEFKISLLIVRSAYILDKFNERDNLDTMLFRFVTIWLPFGMW